MKGRSIWLACLSVFLAMTVLLFGMGHSQAADGNRKTIAVVFDRNIPADLEPGPAQSQNEISEFMEKQLVKLLNKKYKAELVSSEGDYQSGSYDHLLKVKVVKYQRGSSAARMLVGFGAGAAYLDIHYELIGRDGQILIAKDDGVSTSQHWSRIPKKLNKNIYKDVMSAVKP